MKPYFATPEQIDSFKAERKQFMLAYRCPDCLYVSADKLSCSLEYFNCMLMNFEEYFEEGGQFVFCKYFELG